MPSLSALALWYAALVGAALAALRPVVPAVVETVSERPLRHAEIDQRLLTGAADRRGSLAAHGARALNVVLLGDSTAAGLAPVLRVQLRRVLPGRVPTVEAFTYAGFSPLQHVFVNERLLDGTVQVVVLVLNSRFLGLPDRSVYRSMEAAAVLPLDRLAALADLPWAAIGIDRRALWAAALLRLPACDFVARYHADLKARGRALVAAAARGLGGDYAARALFARYALQHAADMARAFDPALWDLERLPPFIDRIVAGQAAAGIVPLVVVDPIPRRRGPLRDPTTLAVARARLETIAAGVRARGGHVLDLHALLTPGEFVDDDGHFGPQGNQKVGTAIADAIGRLVEPTGAARP